MDGNFFNFFWFILFILFFLPVVQQRWLVRTRRKLINQIQKENGSRVIVLVHRQELLSMLGIPFYRFINIEDSEQILRAIHRTDENTPIDLILHTPGGLVLASAQIARALVRHKAAVRVHIPHFAMSGGTLLALAADEIYIHENAVMGPVDPQIGRYPAASILKVLERKSIDKIDDQTLILADQSTKAIEQIEALAFELLKTKHEEKNAREISKILSRGIWTHDYPITPEQAKDMGLPIRTDLSEDVLDLMELYPQPSRRQTSVEYGSEEISNPKKAKKKSSS